MRKALLKKSKSMVWPRINHWFISLLQLRQYLCFDTLSISVDRWGAGRAESTVIFGSKTLGMFVRNFPE